MELGDLFMNIRYESSFHREIYKLATREEYAEVNNWPEDADSIANDLVGWVSPNHKYVMMHANAAGESIPGNRWDSFTSMKDANLMERVYKQKGFLKRYTVGEEDE